jgi:hypothetical protein
MYEVALISHFGEERFDVLLLFVDLLPECFLHFLSPFLLNETNQFNYNT